MKSKHRLTLERYEKYGEGYNHSINYEDKVLKFVGYGRKQTTRPTEGMPKFGLPCIYVHACQSVCLVCACVLVGLPFVCMCVGQSALCMDRSALCVDRSALYVHVCWSVSLVCACVLVCLPCVCMCVGRPALCVHLSISVLCVHVSLNRQMIKCVPTFEHVYTF